MWTDENNTTPLPSYSCFDNLSDIIVTVERWTSYDYSSSLAAGIIVLVWELLGTSLCLFIAVTIIYNKLYRQPIHIIFLTLVISIVIVCFTFFPLSIIAALSGEFIFGSSDSMRCKVCQIGVLSVFAIHSNIFLVALLSLDRFLYIQFPLHYSKYVTAKSTLSTVIAVTLFCIVISAPPLFGFGEIRFTRRISACTYFLSESTNITKNINYVIFSLAVCISGPGLVLIVTNIWLTFIVYKHLKNRYTIGKVKGEDMNGNLKMPKCPACKLFGGTLVLNIIVWFPNIINICFMIAQNVSDESSEDEAISPPNWLFIVSYVVHSSNVFLSPLLQLYLIPDIYNLMKKRTKKLFVKWKVNTLNTDLQP